MKTKKRFSVVVAVFVVLVMTISFVGCSNKNKGNGNNSTECAHEWVAATCTEPEHCSKCNETRGEAAGHKYVYATVDPTCDEAGAKNGECSVCHDKTTEYLPQLSHRYVSKVEEGDCETDTVTTYTCELCKDAYSEVTKRHAGHDTADVTWTVKSEEQEGNSCEYLVTETAKCKTCKEDIERTYHKHVAKWTVDDIEPATCKEEGTVYYECECHDPKYAKTETLPVNPAAHEWSVSDKPGITHECDECGATKSEVEISGNRATLTSQQLTGENISIKTEDYVTLQPDTALAGKMSGGVNIAATPVDKDELPAVDTALAEKLENAPIFNFELKDTEDRAIDFDGGKMTISVPYELDYGEDPTTVAVLYIDGEGKEQLVDAIYGAGMATFTAEHFSHYAVVRLTAAERCARVGHDYNSVDVPATCTEDGYTVKSCRRCGDFVRVAGAKKLGHDYKATVVPATCTEKGYTLMVCSHEGCDDSYVSKYTAMLAHEYTDTVVAPTCTAKGYTAHVCKNCGRSYRDAYVDMIAHNYVNGECTVCHKKSDAKADKSFYLNLVNSIGKSVDGYYIELNNATFEYTTNMMIGGGNDAPEYGREAEGEGNMVVTGEIEAYKLQIALDADGYLVGSGEGKMSYSMSADGREEGGAQKVLLAFRNKNIYASYYQTSITEFGKTVYEDHTVISQDNASLGGITDTVKAFYTDEVKTVVEKFKGNTSDNNPLYGVTTKIFEAVFDRTETQSGYALTINYDKTAKLLAYVNENNGEAVFDALFGEGEFASLIKFVKEVPEMKFGDFVNKLVAKATSYGLTQSDIYGIIDSIVAKVSQENKFDFAEFVKNYNTSTVPEMIELMSGGEMEAEEIAAMITQMAEGYEQMLTAEDVSFMDFVFGMIFGQGEMAEIAPYIKEFAVTALEALNTAAEKTVNVVINTDASGVFESCTVAIKDFAVDLDVSEPLVPSDATIDLTAGISLNVTAGSGAVGSNDNIVVATDNARKSFVNMVKSDKGTPFEGYDKEDTKYYFVRNGEDYLLVPVFEYNRYILNSNNIDNYRETEYEGKECIAVDYSSWSNSYLLDLDGEYSYSKSCNGWTRNSINVKYLRRTVYTLYIDSKYDLLGYELNLEAMEEYLIGEVFGQTIYTNASQGKFSLSAPHKYALIAQKKPTLCEEQGYEKYRCTVCGDIDVHYISLGHSYESTYALKDEELGCEGGVIETHKCTRCGKAESREIPGVYEDGSHRTLRLTYPIADAKCPDTYVEVYGCACGEYVQYIQVSGDCEFQRINRDKEWCESKGEGVCEHGYRMHCIYTYQCGVTACAYTYTEEEITTVPNDNCEVIRSRVITLKDGTKYTMTEKSFEHYDTASTEKTENGLTVRTEVCSRCHKTVRTDKHDSYGRWVYYFDEIRNEGWEKVYEPGSCYCVEYYLDQYGNRIEEKIMFQGLSHETHSTKEDKTSCTQAHTETWTCVVCHEVVDREDYYYGHNYQYDYETGKKVCEDCGMTNDIYADGPVVFENLSGKMGGFRIGYTAYREILEVCFYSEYDGNGGVLIDGIDYDKYDTGLRCGILSINTESVTSWLRENPEGTFTVVFVTVARKDYKDDYPDYLEVSVTFTAEELAEILGIELDSGSESELAA